MRNISSIVLLMVFSMIHLVSCEEFYFPKLEEMPQMLVVESRITNDPKQNFVKITATNGFYEFSTNELVSGINVKLVEIGGKILTATDQRNGKYAFQETPKPGSKYKLRISHRQDTYESDTVVMPSLPSIDSIYTQYQINKTYRTDKFGPLVLIETPGREIYVDAPISTSLQYYRFNWRAVLQWAITPPPTPLGYPAATFGWNSIYDQDLINLAGPKRFSSATQVKKHPILSIPYDQRIYLDSEVKNENGWIIILELFGINEKTHQFYQKLNKQFTAEGNLFDPMFTQVNGNIHCTNDPNKQILGYFEVNSYRQYRYYFNLWGIDQGKVLLREIKKYPEIPNEGQTMRNPPEFWEYTY